MIYKPPSTPSVEFLDLFDDYLCKLPSEKNDCIIMGDFNFDLLCLNSYNLDFLKLDDIHPGSDQSSCYLYDKAKEPEL